MNKDTKSISKEKWRLIILVLYACPFASLVMVQHHLDSSLLIWMCLLVGFVAVILALAAYSLGFTYLVWIGNVLSGASSYWFVRNQASTGWSSFFEPFQPQHALLFYAGALLIVQVLALGIVHILTFFNSQKSWIIKGKKTK